MWASKIAGASPLQPVTLLLGVHELLRRSRCTPSGSQFIRVGYHVTLREERSIATFTSNEVSLVGLLWLRGSEPAAPGVADSVGAALPSPLMPANAS